MWQIYWSYNIDWFNLLTLLATIKKISKLKNSSIQISSLSINRFERSS